MQYKERRIERRGEMESTTRKIQTKKNSDNDRKRQPEKQRKTRERQRQ